MTDTRSSGRSAWNHSAVMIETIEADDAWWPPTFSPPGLGRTRLAWSTIAVDSHSTRSSTACSASRSGSWPVSGAGAGRVDVIDGLRVSH